MRNKPTTKRSKFNFQALYFLVIMASLLVACDDEEPSLSIPDTYISENYDANVTTERTVISELADLTADINMAEANAQSTPVQAIDYPTTLQGITLDSYHELIASWLPELVLAANDDDEFQNPGLNNSPADGEQGGLLGSRLLDGNGLELEQMIQKGSFGAALYNHALTIINGDLSSSAAIDKLIEIHGADPSFDPSTVSAAATYSKRRSDNEGQTGFLYDIANSLITAQAAIEAGSAFDDRRDKALNDYLRYWEESNFATVIYYANATKMLLQSATTIQEDEEREIALGNALHAYAEGVAFAHGFRGLSQKQINDAEIDQILELLLAPAGQTPTSHRFLNEVTLLANLDQIISLIQDIYNFTDEEVNGFIVNN